MTTGASEPVVLTCEESAKEMQRRERNVVMDRIDFIEVIAP